MTTAATQARHIEAARMRDAGFTYRQICDRLGFNYDSGAAGNAVRRGRILLAEQAATPSWLNRRFGIEIEHTGTSLYSSAAAMRAAGLDVIEPGYTHRVTREWKLVPDGSCGNEAVSPILRGADGWGQVKSAMDAIRSAGGRVSRACGMHVHLDMADMDGHAIARLIEFYVEFQSEVDQFVSPSRRTTTGGNRWCRPYFGGARGIADHFRTHGTAMPGADRYHTLNVTSYPKYGTLEFRQHQGCLNAANARAWGNLVMAMTEVAKQDRCSEVEHGANFLSSLAAVVGMTPVQVRRLQSRKDRLARQTAGV